MLGIVEQLVCVLARKFVPTDFSTFSAFILFMRKNRAVSFPESVAFRNHWKAVEVEEDDDDEEEVDEVGDDEDA